MQFVDSTNEIFNKMDWWDKMKDSLLEYNDGRLSGDGGYKSAKKQLKDNFINLCYSYFKSKPGEFIQFCKTDKVYRDNVYKQFLYHDIDMMVFGKSDGYFTDSFPKNKDTIYESNDNITYDYNVTWRGLFTVSVDKYYKQPIKIVV